ncbi:hypothetical protein, partial [Robiginitalea marina]
MIDYLPAFGASVIPEDPVLQTQTLPWRSQGGFVFPVHAFEQARCVPRNTTLPSKAIHFSIGQLRLLKPG